MSLTYTLNQKSVETKNRHFTKEELIHMTTYQLREICIEEKIVNGIFSDFDRDKFIYQILRFRGREDRLLITNYNKDGFERICDTINQAKISFTKSNVKGLAKLICYENIATEIFDGFTISYDKDLVDTNALLMSGTEICTIIQIKAKKDDKDRLYVTKAKDIPCTESNRKNYSLYAMDRRYSDLIYDIYNEGREILPEHLSFYVVEVLNFEVRKLINSTMPLAIDFGTSNTTAGMYLDDRYFETLSGDPALIKLKQNDVNYLYHLNEKGGNVPTIPTVIGVTKIENNDIHYVFGYEATKLFQMSHMEDGFSVFYDIKRFVSEPDKLEEVVDKDGHRTFIPRKELIKVYLEYIIDVAKQRFKCNITHLHISAPVKQKMLFQKLFDEILSDYTLEKEQMLDEGVAVLYNSISEMIKLNKFEPNTEYKALIIDCGGGTTDLSSCTFSVENKRVSYQINIKTAYENGDTDFGGNNLTYRIMQLIKISLAYAFDKTESIEDLIEDFDIDLFREVDRAGDKFNIYERLESIYKLTEDIIPTRFKDYEHKNRSDYYAVKNNFYYLFDMAEKVKTEFYTKTGTLRIALSTVLLNEIATTSILVSRFKLYVKEKDILVVQKDIPTIYISIYELNLLLKADIYAIVKKFIGRLYENDELSEFAILKLTGQSCKIDLFREALKEFIPGKMIASSKKADQIDHLYELKLICLNGAIKYLKDVKFGFADVLISGEKSSFPYTITGMTHEGKETLLINGLGKKQTYGYLSRNMADITLKLFLKDMEGTIRYTYSMSKNPKEFKEISANELSNLYNRRIMQDDIDDIVERELKFFVISEEQNWGFLVIPVYRLNDKLFSLDGEFFSFETEGWLKNFFDGTR